MVRNKHRKEDRGLTQEQWVERIILWMTPFLTSGNPIPLPRRIPRLAIWKLRKEFKNLSATFRACRDFEKSFDKLTLKKLKSKDAEKCLREVLDCFFGIIERGLKKDARGTKIPVKKFKYELMGCNNMYSFFMRKFDDVPLAITLQLRHRLTHNGQQILSCNKLCKGNYMLVLEDMSNDESPILRALTEVWNSNNCAPMIFEIRTLLASAYRTLIFYLICEK